MFSGGSMHAWRRRGLLETHLAFHRRGSDRDPCKARRHLQRKTDCSDCGLARSKCSVFSAATSDRRSARTPNSVQGSWRERCLLTVRSAAARPAAAERTGGRCGRASSSGRPSRAQGLGRAAARRSLTNRRTWRALSESSSLRGRRQRRLPGGGTDRLPDEYRIFRRRPRWGGRKESGNADPKRVELRSPQSARAPRHATSCQRCVIGNERRVCLATPPWTRLSSGEHSPRGRFWLGDKDVAVLGPRFLYSVPGVLLFFLSPSYRILGSPIIDSKAAKCPRLTKFEEHSVMSLASEVASFIPVRPYA